MKDIAVVHICHPSIDSGYFGKKYLIEEDAQISNNKISHEDIIKAIENNEAVAATDLTLVTVGKFPVTDVCVYSAKTVLPLETRP